MGGALPFVGGTESEGLNESSPNDVSRYIGSNAGVVRVGESEKEKEAGLEAGRPGILFLSVSEEREERDDGGEVGERERAREGG